MHVKKKTIVFDARMLDKSGIGTYIKNVVQPITEAYNFIFLGNEEEIRHNFNGGRIIRYNHPIYSIKEQLYIPVKVPMCDLFWSPHINVPLLPVLTQKRLVTIHDMFHAAQMSQMSRIKRAYTRLILNSLNIYKPEVITVSEFSKTEITKYTKIPDHKITVAYNGYNADKFKTNYPNHRNENPYILYVGNVKPHKNLSLIVEAFRILKNENRLMVKLKIVGKKEGFITGDDSVGEKIRLYGLENDILFTGHITDDELLKSYQNAELLIFPSLYEGFGLPPLEAMACGRVSIVTDIPVLRELYADTALFTPTHDPQHLATQIVSVFENRIPLEPLKANFDSALQKYTWQKSQEIHMKVIHGILKD